MANVRTMWPYLEALFRDVGVVELRHQVDDRWTSGYFDAPEKIMAVACKLSHEGNLFTSLNPPKFRPATNGMNGRALKNDDVLRYARLFFDFDVVRPKDTSSTEDELSDAIAAASNAENFFTALGWPKPARAVSGNGAHRLYRIAMPNNDATSEMLRTIYMGLRCDLSTDSVVFDATVRNAARICCLYGSVKRKGTPTKSRPHRQSHIEIPKPWKQVHRRQLESLARYYTPKPARIPIQIPASVPFVTGVGAYRTLDAVGWFQAHGNYKRRLERGKHAVICPWLSQHSTPDHPLKTDTVIWTGTSNWPTFYCAHAHCLGRTIKDVMALWGDADRFCTEEWRTRS